MRAVLAWADQVPEHEGLKSAFYDLAFRPDGSQLVAAVGSRVLIYDAADGDLLHSLTGHKDAVYCVAYSRDGKRFASGGADKSVIIWTQKAEGILKYNHSDSVQCLSYNPVTQQMMELIIVRSWQVVLLVISEFGHQSKSLFLSTEPLQRYCVCHGQEMGTFWHWACTVARFIYVIIERSGPVWTLQWNLMQIKTSDTLAVGCWDGTLSFYDFSGKQIGKDKELGFDPCCVSYHDGKYLCLGGSNKQVVLYSKDGIYLSTFCETSDWVWTVKSRPKHDFVAVGCNDGTISMLQLVFSTVHGLYRETYAFRDTMTDIVIQNLVSSEKVRIKCRDHIRKIAVYEEHLAIQLSECIVVYKLQIEANSKLQYRVCAKINHSFECNLLVVTSKHITLCQDNKLQLYTFDGVKEKEWLLESTIRYIKVCGGPHGGEGLLIGMKNGSIVKIYINNMFPVLLYKHTTSIRCLDLSSRRSQLAIVDESSILLIYNLQIKEISFEERFASSVAWNTEFEDMFCYSGNGNLNIKTADFPVHSQKLQGYVVGFQSSKIFCLHHSSMQTVEVPQSASLHQYIIKGDFESAYEVACLGVTEVDWRTLALQALQAQSWKIAVAGFTHIKDIPFLDLVNLLNLGEGTRYHKSHIVALVLSYEGRFKEAADAYCEVGEIAKAMEMYADLRMFDEAKALADSCQKNDASKDTNVQEIIQRQAERTEETNDHETAADMFLIAGQPDKALKILVEHGPASKLIEVARKLKRTDADKLRLCANILQSNGLNSHAFETYTKLGDFRSVLLLHMELCQWDDAFAIKKLHPEIEEDVSLAYADWLVQNDRFEDAIVAYKQATRPELAKRLLKQLMRNAAKEKRSKDTAYYCWRIALESLSEWCETDRDHTAEEEKTAQEFMLSSEHAEIYYAYSFIDQSINEPFQTSQPETLFNIARFLLARVPKQMPYGVSLVNILVTLAKHSEQLGNP
ncbi:hypothetical protein O6H91_19G029500 [Diphasiastrum complanatum]|uniref:Uncharacterized protein n=1 Tax=Diphasiastrum complanatum TaxID=34168 RepID=A0ACC2ATX3_DIPCM|nr:hypothetical protein O6H91_19G029500 [Diphasiastrum complanatum]